jgi:arginyl-tRNA synthetase
VTEFHNIIYLKLSTLIGEAVKKAFDGTELSQNEIISMIGGAPNLKIGHFAFPCFILAKPLKKGPPQISKALLENIEKPEWIQEVITQGPYLNFFLTPKAYGEFVIEAILGGAYFKQKISNDQRKTMVEYSQPNTHKELHVGHMRNLCLGNAIVRMSQYAGVETIPVTYPGDVGTHVAKCLWFYKYHNKEKPPETNKGAWLGRLYSNANNLLEDQKGSDKEESNREILTSILKELEDKKGEYFELWKETREWSIALMKEAYSWAGVEFDRWFWESEVDSPSLELAKKYQAEGLFKVDDGAVGIDLSEDKLGFCILIKRDGTGLYATKDLLLAKKKFEEFNIARNIYIVDSRQSHHFKQVFKVLELMGFEQSKDCFHLQYDVVDLPDGAMSSRTGNIIPLMDLIAQMEETIKKNYLNRYLEDSSSGWTKEEVDSTASMVANGAIKYGMIRVDNNRKIIFDMDEWLKLDGETGPYLQYVHARICSLSDKLGYKSGPSDWSLLKTTQELALLQKLSLFNSIVESSVASLKTIHLCSYLYELGKLFNSFYSECPIGKADSLELRTARLALAVAAGKVMNKGLEILGIPAPTKM